MAGRNSKKPTYYSSLTVENIRCFGSEQTLDLTDKGGRPARWTLLLGNNGVGKTTLLECLAWARPVPEYDPRPGGSTSTERTGTKSILDALEDNSELDSLIKSGPNVEARITAELSHGVGFARQAGSKKSSLKLVTRLSRKSDKFEDVRNDSSRDTDVDELNVYGYSANRHLQKDYFAEAEPDVDVHLFSDSGDLFDPEDVLSKLDHLALRKDKQAERLLYDLKTLLADLLPDITSPEDIKVVGPTQALGRPARTSGVLVKTLSGWVRLSKLSLGEKTVFAWAVDLGMRMHLRHGSRGNPLGQPAIVLIDEIDLHLHPKWQRDIRARLTSRFPKTQFICTAHSPLMAQEAEQDNVAVLMWDDEQGEVRIENNPERVRGWRIDQILLSDLFGLDGVRSKETEELIARRRQLLSKARRTREQKKELAALDKKIASLPGAAPSEQERTILHLLERAASAIDSD